MGGGDRGAGTREYWGREIYGRWEKRGREAGSPGGGGGLKEIVKILQHWHNISQ